MVWLSLILDMLELLQCTERQSCASTFSCLRSHSMYAGAIQEVQSLLNDSDPVEETGPSVIPVRLS